MNEHETKERILQSLLDFLSKGDKGYNRILTSEEKHYLDTESYGYLLSLYQIGSIDSIKLEKIIEVCVYIAMLESRPIQLSRTKQLVNILLHYDSSNIPSREFSFLVDQLENDEVQIELIH